MTWEKAKVQAKDKTTVMMIINCRKESDVEEIQKGL